MGKGAIMTDAELDREEWIEERIGILMHSAGYSEEIAESMAVAQWNAMQELTGTLQEPSE
jgi:hypothetical protein